MLATFAALLWVLFGDVCPLYDQVLQLCRVLKYPSLKAVKSKFNRVRCAQITWKVWKRLVCSSTSGLDPMISKINYQEYYPQLIWEVWLGMCGAISCWIMSPCQGNGIINIMGTTIKPTTARGKGILVKTMGNFTVPFQWQGVQTLINSHQEIQMDHRNHNGGDFRWQDQNIAIQFHQVYGKVTAGIYHTLFWKGVNCG